MPGWPKHPMVTLAAAACIAGLATPIHYSGRLSSSSVGPLGEIEHMCSGEAATVLGAHFPISFVGFNYNSFTGKCEVNQLGESAATLATVAAALMLAGLFGDPLGDGLASLMRRWR